MLCYQACYGIKPVRGREFQFQENERICVELASYRKESKATLTCLYQENQQLTTQLANTKLAHAWKFIVLILRIIICALITNELPASCHATLIQTSSLSIWCPWS